MYKAEKTFYGMKVAFEGYINAEEMLRWTQEAKEVGKTLKKGFGLLADLRGMAPLPKDAQELLKKSQRRAKEQGMVRSAVVLDDTITIMQFKRIGRETDLSKEERYIDASSVSNWEQVALDWIVKGIDPDS